MSPSGLMEQASQIPLQFVVEKLWEGHCVVITGRYTKTQYLIYTVSCTQPNSMCKAVQGRSSV